MINCGEKIRDLRKGQNLSQNDLALKTNMPQTSISTWEKSAEPPLEFIRKALNILNPKTKLWEFFIEDPEELKDYIPSWITPQQIEFLQLFNQLPQKKQLKYINAFIQIVEADQV